MALSDMTPADLAAVVGNNEDGGFGNGNGWWIILLFLFLGWGNRGWGNGGNGAGDVGGNELYPWMENQGNIFNGFANAEVSRCNSQANILQTLGNNQMGLYQTLNANQNATIANCCCENRLGIANLGADIAREACADRAAVSDGIRDILANQTMSVQRILDQMCQDKIDAKNEEIANLRQQVNMMNLAASQNLQTAQLLADNAAQTAALEQYLAPVPRPAYVVQNPNCCQQNFGCGCGTF